MIKNYGLALGGGAARGLTHIGVIRYIEQQDIQINEVSGTSMGAIIAACFALGYNSTKMIDIAKTIPYLKLIDLGSRDGVIKGKKIHTKLSSIFENKNIEDCVIPLKIIATNLSSGEKTIFTSGSIADAIRASISLPSIMKPFLLGGEEYIDGGITSNLPIEVLNNNNIIAVSALKGVDREIKRTNNIFNFSLDKSFFAMNYQILQKAIIIMMKQNELSSLSSSQKDIILLEPDFGKLEYIHFNKVDEFVEVGEKIAQKKLSGIA